MQYAVSITATYLSIFCPIFGIIFQLNNCSATFTVNLEHNPLLKNNRRKILKQNKSF